MVRLLAVQTAIAVLKRAIAVSSKLRPRTWACLAVIQVMLAALCFWGYQQSREQRVHPQEVSVAQVRLNTAAVTDSDGDTLLYTYSTTGGRITGDGPNATLDLTSVAPGTYTITVEVDDYCGCIAYTSTAQSVYALGLFTLLAHEYAWGGMDFPPDVHPHFQLGSRQSFMAERRLFLRDLWEKLYPRHEPPFFSQPSAPGDTSLLDVLQKLALLFQSIVLATGSIVASVLGVLGYFRAKADLELKRLQIREMQIKLELLERERDRARQEAARSSIILLS